MRLAARVEGLGLRAYGLGLRVQGYSPLLPPKSSYECRRTNVAPNRKTLIDSHPEFRV